MKKSIIYSLVLLMLCSVAGCEKKNKEEEQAGSLLKTARSAYEQGLYDDALMWVDSIKKAYPKAFEARQKGVDLKNEIIIAQAQDVVAKADSVRISLQQEVDDMHRKLILVKDKRYEEQGNYFYPSQAELANSTRTYLRAQISEGGVFALTSVYHGASALHHTRIRITAPDGTSAETTSGSPFRNTLKTAVSEKVDYLVENGADKVARFIAERENQNLRLEFMGVRTLVVSFPSSDRKGISILYRLYEKEDMLQKLEKEKEDALVKVRFYQAKAGQKKRNEALEN